MPPVSTVTQDVEVRPPAPPAAPAGRFVHLHLHSEYSLLDGGARIAQIIDTVRAAGMDAVALTDHGNLYGAVEFYTKARAAGIRPILGIEAYVAPGDRTQRSPGPTGQSNFHLVLLAENLTGWRNLVRLSSDAFVRGFYYRPRMDKTTLARWCDGLIAINGHVGSSLAHHLLQYDQSRDERHFQAAIDEARWHAQTFAPDPEGRPRFYVELQKNGVAEQLRINDHLRRLAGELDLPLVCDNDVHYLTAESWDAHDSLCCISMGRTKDDPARLHYSRELYLRSPAEMVELFTDCPEAVENTVRIAERCQVDLDLEASHTPMVRIEHSGHRPPYDGTDATEWFKGFCAEFQLLPFDAGAGELTVEDVARECDRALRDLCEAGVIWRYGPEGVTAEIRARLDRELQILADKSISAYFLIVWDVVNWARQRGVPANARGSGVGTMVGYVLGLSNACPVRYGLLFERFTDPDRSEYPDIDIDICQDGRAEVIAYVRQKYGHVAQIITFGRLKAKAAIKDVARVHGLSPADGQRLANFVPTELNITIDAALEREPEFRQQYENEPTVSRVIDTARALEGHARHAGVHAAGVVIATRPLEEIVPLGRATGNEDIITQWDGPTCERVGLLKMDFLGLRTLSTIERACQLIRQSLPDEAIRAAVGRGEDGGPHPLDLDRLRYDDQRVLDLFCRADTAGVFQFESGGMRKLLLQMKPDRLEDLIAANALFRPGPMELIPQYCARKHGREPVPAMHPIVDRHTAETYGIMVYQEQVMQIVHELGDIPLRRAYTLIKAIGKKKHRVIDAERPRFREGSRERGLEGRHADELFDLILKFAGYGFNKSHSTGYAIIAYQTAYLKTYFPNQYMAALLTYESAARKIDDWVPYLQDCRQMVFPDSTPQRHHVGVVVRPPDLNRSEAEFSVVFDEDEPVDAVHGHVRFGLSAVKGVSKTAIRSIVEQRRKTGSFATIYELCERLNPQVLSKATLEALVQCGALDSLHGAERRAAMMATIEEALSAGQRAAEDRRRGQMTMFAGPESTAEPAEVPPPRPLPDVPAWDRLDMLAREQHVLGFHVSGHPLDAFQSLIETFCNATAAGAAHLNQDAPVVLGGLLTRVQLKLVKRGASSGQKMATISLQDRTGTVSGVVFASVFATSAQHLQESAVVVLVGRMDLRQGEPQVVVDQVIPIEQAPRHLAGTVEIDLDGRGGGLKEQMEMTAGLLQQAHASRGLEGSHPADVILHLHTAGKRVSLRSRRLRAVADPFLLQQLRELAGDQNVRMTARKNIGGRSRR